MLRARASTEHRRGAPACDFRSDDDGSAALEFILVGLVLLVPIVYLVIALGAIQGQALGVETGARQLARAIEANDMFVVPKPLSQERLEELLMEHGILDA